jgi:hypothetical protein
MREYETTDRVLIDLRDERDHLSIQISLLKDGDRIDPGVLSTLQRNLGILDRRIEGHKSPVDA